MGQNTLRMRCEEVGNEWPKADARVRAKGDALGPEETRVSIIGNAMRLLWALHLDAQKCCLMLFFIALRAYYIFQESFAGFKQ